MAYQNLLHYDGNLHGKIAYQGIEYDDELPDTMVMASPGGVSSTFGHYTKGFYGQGGSSWDAYAGQGFRYPYGEYGNMYASGENALTSMRALSVPPDTRFYNRQSAPKFDDNNIELIENFTHTDGNSTPTKPIRLKFKKNAFVIFIVLLLAYITFSFWTTTGTKFIQTIFHADQPFDWKTGLIYSVALTLITFVLASFLGYPDILVGSEEEI